jgi:hypothetical protein
VLLAMLKFDEGINSLAEEIFYQSNLLKFDWVHWGDFPHRSVPILKGIQVGSY